MRASYAAALAASHVDAVSTVVGVDFRGDQATVFETVTGKGLISPQRNELNALGVNPAHHTVMAGALIIVAPGVVSLIEG